MSIFFDASICVTGAALNSFVRYYFSAAKSLEVFSSNGYNHVTDHVIIFDDPTKSELFLSAATGCIITLFGEYAPYYNYSAVVRTPSKGGIDLPKQELGVTLNDKDKEGMLINYLVNDIKSNTGNIVNAGEGMSLKLDEITKQQLELENSQHHRNEDIANWVKHDVNNVIKALEDGVNVETILNSRYETDVKSALNSEHYIIVPKKENIDNVDTNILKNMGETIGNDVEFIGGNKDNQEHQDL